MTLALGLLLTLFLTMKLRKNPIFLCRPVLVYLGVNHATCNNLISCDYLHNQGNMAIDNSRIFLPRFFNVQE